MSLIEPAEPAVLASAVVDTLAVHADPQSREASIFYWERGRPDTQAVVDAVRAVEDPAVRESAEAQLADPADPAVYHALHDGLVAAYRGARTEAVDRLFAHAWHAECNSRLGFHLGPRYRHSTASPITADRLRTPAGEGSGQQGGAPDAPVLVVIPFRDRGLHARRLRNLLACLRALRDQSVPRSGYRVVVVETDDAPRWRESLAPLADDYLFAYKPGTFNKSWAVNVGIVNAAAGSEVVCVLDADVLVDRDFIARNAARFRRPGTMGHLSYRDMWCLDESATAAAIGQRVLDGQPAADPDRLRAFVLRRPPGCCVWFRASAFHRIGGMDERFEGWGGEDNDFAYRMDTNSAFDSYDDVLLHMYHPSSAVLREDGELVNAHIPALSWPPDAVIGDSRRFVGPPAPADRAGQGVAPGVRHEAVPASRSER